MNEFLRMIAEKLSTYRFFNFIIPGAVLIGFIKYFHLINIPKTNIWWFLLLSYFCGIVLSRIGSVVVEEPMKSLKIIKKYDVNNYIMKQKENTLVGTMLELANTYRTISALMLIILILTIISFPFECKTFKYLFVEFLLLILFIYSFYKQYNYFIKTLS